jgi:hypothetical protein
MASPETRKTPGQGGPFLLRNLPIDTDSNNELGPSLQARKLAARFGFTYETAVAISALAFAVAR